MKGPRKTPDWVAPTVATILVVGCLILMGWVLINFYPEALGVWTSSVSVAVVTFLLNFLLKK